MRRYSLAAWFWTLAIVGVAPSSTLAQCHWEIGRGQEAAGPLGSVSDTISWDFDGAGPEPTKLIAAGSFVVAGTRIVNNIAAWDGTSWTPLGHGFNGSVSALAIFNGQLIAAGGFTFSGTQPCNRIARWDGATWQPLGTGLDSNASILTLFNNRLYVAGSFVNAGGAPAAKIASWDGSVWRSLGAGPTGSSPNIYAMAVFENTLVVGGGFTGIGGIAASAIARYDGVSWTTLGSGITGGAFPRVHALAAYNSIVISSPSVLYVGGGFTTAGGVPSANVASYRTASGWSAVSTGLGGTVTRLLISVAPVGARVTLTAVSQAQAPWTGGVYQWVSNVGVWNAILAAATPLDVVGHLGSFGGAWTASTSRGGLSRWNGSSWVPFGNGINGGITRVVAFHGQLHAIGTFNYADQQPADGIARLDSNGWHPLPVLSGMSTMTDAVVHQNQIVVAGTMGAQTLVRRWTGSQWFTMGSAFFQAGTSPVLHVSGTDLYVGTGRFVYRWNGLAWQQLGGETGLGDNVNGVVRIDDTLYAGEYFSLRSLAPGATTWTATPMPVTGLYFTKWRNHLIAGGTGMNSHGVYERLGANWATILGADPPPSIQAISTLDADLLLAVNNTIARYDGNTFTPLGVYAGNLRAFTTLGTDLIAAGQISLIDGVASPMFARWTCRCPADLDDGSATGTPDGGVTIEDLLYYLGLFAGGNVAGDLDDGSGTGTPDGGVTIEDLLYFLGRFDAGC